MWTHHISVSLKEHRQFNFWTKFGNFDHSAIPSWANALFAEKCAMMQKIVQARDKVQTVCTIINGAKIILKLHLTFWSWDMCLLVILTEHTTYTVKNMQEKLEHIGKVIFDVPFMIQSNVESMKKILDQPKKLESL